MKRRRHTWLFGAAIVALLVCGGLYVRSLRAEIAMQRLALDERRQHLDSLRAERLSLRRLRLEDRLLAPLPHAADPVTNEVLLRAALDDLMATHGLLGTVHVHPVAPDASFHEAIGIDSVPIDLGIDDYADYGQVVGLVDDLGRHAVIVDGFCVGCTDIGVPGRVRLKLRYFVPST